MSDIIKLLPDSVANQIAAGEVIQRPASVIKELVENAIDAGASSIKIVLKDAGRTLIQVIDNGSGMSDTDARLAFERHSTSKITNANDLFSLHTMGFRGEALASIAAIAQVELRTRKKGAEMGTKLCISASKCESQEPDFCQEGSNFMIKNIFFNVPARRKFLKSNKVELSNIVKEFEKLALVNHSTEFMLINDDSTIFQLMAGDSFKKRIASLFTRSIEQQLITIETETMLIKISGFIGRPENARKRNALQFFFVNGRHMRHPYFHKAIMNCYDQLIPADEQPNYFINFEVAPSTIDVNIHPTKSEIKFENEQVIWQIIYAAVKEALGKFSAIPSIDFDTEGIFEISMDTNTDTPEQPKIQFDPTYNPFTDQRRASTSAPATHNSKFGNFNNDNLDNWEALYESFENKKPAEATQTVESSFGFETTNKKESNIFSSKFSESHFGKQYMQLKSKYIVICDQFGILLIDQHRAHVRILFDKMMDATTIGIVESQRVLFPEVLQLSPAQDPIVEELSVTLESMGFDISFLGNSSWAINSVPAILNGLNAKEFISDIIDSAITGGKELPQKIKEHIALSSAKATAIQHGKILTNEEMAMLASDLFSCKEQNYTPDGKIIISTISNDEIAKLFL